MCVCGCVCLCTHHEISIRIIYTCHLGSFLFNMKRRRRQTKLRAFHLCESERFYRWYHIMLCLYFALLCFALIIILFVVSSQLLAGPLFSISSFLLLQFSTLCVCIVRRQQWQKQKYQHQHQRQQNLYRILRNLSPSNAFTKVSHDTFDPVFS